MKRILITALFIIIVISLQPALAMMRYKDRNYDEQLQLKIAQYQAYAREQLNPYFIRAKLPYPPRQIALLVFKQSKHLELWGRRAAGSWHYVKSFGILAASGHAGPKLRNWDQQVPEGIYHIVALNPISHFHLSMRLDYPNAFDRIHALLDGRTHLGGDIFIHGSNHSIGCIAIGNTSINQLFVLADLVGLDNIEVIIAPSDLRHVRPFATKNDPWWVKSLYTQIQIALRRFHQS